MGLLTPAEEEKPAAAEEPSEPAVEPSELAEEASKPTEEAEAASKPTEEAEAASKPTEEAEEEVDSGEAINGTPVEPVKIFFLDVNSFDSIYPFTWSIDFNLII